MLEGRRAIYDATPWTELTTWFSWTHLPLSKTFPWSTEVLFPHQAELSTQMRAWGVLEGEERAMVLLQRAAETNS